MPVPIKTNHSDHHFVWTDCFLSSPKVEIAIPAPRLPRLDKLDDAFWTNVLREWNALTNGDINLHRWTDFKKSVLQYGLKVRRDRNRSTMSKWKEILRGDAISQEELEELSFDWNTHFKNDNTRSTTASGVNRPKEREQSAGRKHPINTRKAVLYPDVSTCSQHAGTRPMLTSSHPTAVPAKLPLPSVADQLDIRIVAMRKAQLKKF